MHAKHKRETEKYALANKISTSWFGRPFTISGQERSGPYFYSPGARTGRVRYISGPGDHVTVEERPPLLQAAAMLWYISVSLSHDSSLHDCTCKLRHWYRNTRNVTSTHPPQPSSVSLPVIDRQCFGLRVRYASIILSRPIRWAYREQMCRLKHFRRKSYDTTRHYKLFNQLKQLQGKCK